MRYGTTVRLMRIDGTRVRATGKKSLAAPTVIVVRPSRGDSAIDAKSTAGGPPAGDGLVGGDEIEPLWRSVDCDIFPRERLIRDQF